MAMTQLYETKFIEQAMTDIGLCDKVDTLLDVLDKMELDRKLNKSIEEADCIEILGIHHERRGTGFNVAM